MGYISAKTKREEEHMSNRKVYFTAQEVASILGVSVGHSYKLIRKMNEELADKGYLYVAGKVPVAYFEERYYGVLA